ncbi:hypothetical protein [Streptomyces parvulus]|uniref:hypothetical protein n=1 Tax=Streptomyces parvulus TaxID=146923 RepID=UPI0036956BBF
MTLQQVLAEILASEPLLAEARADPEAFARAHDVDADTVCRLVASPGLHTSASIVRAARAGRILAAYPGTFAVVGSAAGRAALMSAAMTAGAVSTLAGLGEVGERLAHSVSVDAPRQVPVADLGLLREMIRYETACHRLRLSARSTADVPEMPALAPGVLLTSFDRPVAAIRRHVLEGDQGSEGVGPVGTSHYLLRSVGDPVRVLAHRLAPLLAALLSACDGRREACLVAAEAGVPAETGFRSLCRLEEQGVITWPGAAHQTVKPAPALARDPGDRNEA